ncbi:MAG: hypothetical protein HFJ09_06995 [Lachnospiraceae bacterium]|nr:hypothetical protein [Lachnospiraceae bacterium]
MAPVVTRDRLANMQQLQWSSQKGRKVLGTQFLALLLSAFILTVIDLVIFIGAYSTLGTGVFWNNPIHTFCEYVNVFWFDLTYGQYVMCIIGIAVILSLGMAVLVFVMFVLFINIAMTDNLFSIRGILSQITGVAGIEVWTAIGVLIIAIVMCVWTLWHEKKCEV